ncbi:hypothetical protein CFIMG_008240RA00001 [Ceratocystis fimbriata CBS 114723]|uniref:Uncharacterized protein n=1 Tax=Ceratocystis fimbriata CBS 114723 TaxID=1035309 RepID=A0A2C5X5S3_9PEZI|nr:hypothetical protein CFIMG_008240RA00001 [Ceratocystis fimbriata CBS 114723]
MVSSTSASPQPRSLLLAGPSFDQSSNSYVHQPLPQMSSLPHSQAQVQVQVQAQKLDLVTSQAAKSLASGSSPGTPRPPRRSAVRHSRDISVTFARRASLLSVAAGTTGTTDAANTSEKGGKKSGMADGCRQYACLASSGNVLDNHKIDADTQGSGLGGSVVAGYNADTSGQACFPRSSSAPPTSLPRPSSMVPQDPVSVAQAVPAILDQSQACLKQICYQNNGEDNEGIIQLCSPPTALSAEFPLYEHENKVILLSPSGNQQDNRQQGKPNSASSSADDADRAALNQPLPTLSPSPLPPLPSPSFLSSLSRRPTSSPVSPYSVLQPRTTLPRPQALVFDGTEFDCSPYMPVPLPPSWLSPTARAFSETTGSPSTATGTDVGLSSFSPSPFATTARINACDEARLPAGPLLKGGCSLPCARAAASATTTHLQLQSHQSSRFPWASTSSRFSAWSLSPSACSEQDGEEKETTVNLGLHLVGEEQQELEATVSHQLSRQYETKLVPGGEEMQAAAKNENAEVVHIPFVSSLSSLSSSSSSSSSPQSPPSAQSDPTPLSLQTSTFTQTETQAQTQTQLIGYSHSVFLYKRPTERDPSCRCDSSHSETSIQSVQPQNDCHTVSLSLPLTLPFVPTLPPTLAAIPAHISDIEPPSPAFSFCSENLSLRPLSAASSVPSTHPSPSLAAGSRMTSLYIPDSLNEMGSGFSTPWGTPKSPRPAALLNACSCTITMPKSPNAMDFTTQSPSPAMLSPRKVSAASTTSSVSSAPSSSFSSSDTEGRSSSTTTTCSPPFTPRNSLFSGSQSNLHVHMSPFQPYRSPPPHPKHLSQLVETAHTPVRQPVRPYSNSSVVPSNLLSSSNAPATELAANAKSLPPTPSSHLSPPPPPPPAYQCSLLPWSPSKKAMPRSMTVAEPQVSYFDTDTEEEEEEEADLQDARDRARAISRLFGPKRKSLHYATTSGSISSAAPGSRMSATESSRAREKEAKTRGGKAEKRKSKDAKSDKSDSEQHSDSEPGTLLGLATAGDRNSFLQRTNEQMLGMFTHMRLSSGFMSKKQKKERRKQNIKKHIRVLHETGTDLGASATIV